MAQQIVEVQRRIQQLRRFEQRLKTGLIEAGSVGRASALPPGFRPASSNSGALCEACLMA